MKISLLLVVYAFHAVFYVIFFLRLLHVELKLSLEAKDGNEGKYFYVFLLFSTIIFSIFVSFRKANVITERKKRNKLLGGTSSIKHTLLAKDKLI